MLSLITLLIVLPHSGFCSSTLVLPSRTVVIKLPYVNATIPCRYTLPDKVTTTIWTRGGVTGDVVLKNSSAGIVEPGHDYEGLVSFGEECSLVFKSPELKHDGNYTVTIHNDGDRSQTVRVVVVGENATVYSSDTADNKSSPTGSNTTKPASESDNSTGWIVVTVIAVVGLILALILVGVMFHEVPENRTWVRNTCSSCSSCCSQGDPVPPDEPDN